MSITCPKLANEMCVQPGRVVFVSVLDDICCSNPPIPHCHKIHSHSCTSNRLRQFEELVFS